MNSSLCHAAIFAMAVLSISSAAYAVEPADAPCARLEALTIPDVTVTSATDVAAGNFTASGLPHPVATTDFCRVQLKAHPTPDSDIAIEVWMPPPSAWNHKFEGIGNGGYQGNFNYATMAAAVKAGYAVTATDTGHTGDDLKFGLGHPEKVIDWSYRAIHEAAEQGKLVARNYYGRFADHNYFVGCSTGGHQALSEAQRYPADYDGIVAGDPAWDRVHQTAAYLWSWKATHDDTGAPLLAQPQLQLVTKSAIAACDALDGVKDGVIDDPRRCNFDVATLACKPGQAGDQCLTAFQITAFKKVYAGTFDPRTHKQIFPGWSLGSESFGDRPSSGWEAFILAPKESMRINVFRYFLYDDPSWDWHTFDYDHDMAYADANIGYMGATDGDLSGFRNRGGKLLLTTGWADPVAAPLDIIKYYDKATAAMGGLRKTQEFFRFYMAPGMGHCGGGPGPNTFDSLGALETWVETGKAPDRIIASHLTGGKVDRTRPLCPFPEVARWKGTGSTDNAINFSCVEEKHTAKK